MNRILTVPDDVAERYFPNASWFLFPGYKTSWEEAQWILNALRGALNKRARLAAVLELLHPLHSQVARTCELLVGQAVPPVGSVQLRDAAASWHAGRGSAVSDVHLGRDVLEVVCASAEAARNETNPPAGLYGAPEGRRKAIIKNPETLRKLV